MGEQLPDQDIIPEQCDGRGEDGVIMIESGVDDLFIEDWVCENIDLEDLPLSDREVEETNGDFICGGVQDGGHCENKGYA